MGIRVKKAGRQAGHVRMRDSENGPYASLHALLCATSMVGDDGEDGWTRGRFFAISSSMSVADRANV
ncbi:hypothetical protein SDJN02_24707, partial [Cucurbita argyrosperma subsp. argyrosperma]